MIEVYHDVQVGGHNCVNFVICENIGLDRID